MRQRGSPGRRDRAPRLLAVFIGMGVFMSVVAELYRRARQTRRGHLSAE